jgi:hypothetical protein
VHDRYWNEHGGGGDVRPVFAAIVAALRERTTNRAVPLARARGPVADDAQRADAQLRPVNTDPDGRDGDAVTHAPERTPAAPRRELPGEARVSGYLHALAGLPPQSRDPAYLTGYRIGKSVAAHAA